MTDLEMTLICAQATEVWTVAREWYPTMTLDPTFSGVEVRAGTVYIIPNNPMRQGPQRFDPLHNDAEAMWLLKVENLLIELDANQPGKRVRYPGTDIIAVLRHDPTGYSLNRAIVECIASRHAISNSPKETPQC